MRPYLVNLTWEACTNSDLEQAGSPGILTVTVKMQSRLIDQTHALPYSPSFSGEIHGEILYRGSQ